MIFCSGPSAPVHFPFFSSDSHTPFYKKILSWTKSKEGIFFNIFFRRMIFRSLNCEHFIPPAWEISRCTKYFLRTKGADCRSAFICVKLTPLLSISFVVVDIILAVRLFGLRPCYPSCEVWNDWVAVSSCFHFFDSV